VLTTAKANPGKLNVGTISPAARSNLAGELFLSTAGIEALVVPHKDHRRGDRRRGGNGNVDLGFDFIAPLISAIRSGQLRALA